MCARYNWRSEGLGARSVLCACCGFPECPMMMQIRLTLLNGLRGVFLLVTPWIRRVDGERSLQYNAVFCGAHVGPDAADGHHRFVVIGSITMMCIGAVNVSLLLLLSRQSVSRFSCLGLVIRRRNVELWIVFFMSCHGSSAVFRWAGGLGVSCNFWH